MRQDQFIVLALQRQEELRRVAREASVTRDLGAGPGRVGVRALPLRMLDRVLGPH